MDQKQTDLDTIATLVAASGSEAAAAAWRRVAALVASPPRAMGGAWHGADKLANQIYRNGGHDPRLLPANEIEQLLYRLVRAVEEMQVLFADALQRPEVEALAVSYPLPMDDGYQPSYCDDCGEQLTPGGRCVNQGCW